MFRGTRFQKYLSRYVRGETSFVGKKKLNRRRLSVQKGQEVKGIKTTLAGKGNSLGVNKQIQRQTC